MLRDCPFPDPSRAPDLRASYISVTDPRHGTYVDNRPTRGGFFFNAQSHWHSLVEDGSFGLGLVRQTQPLDIPATGERHIHLEVDLKTSARRYVRIMLSPEVTSTLTDDRDPPNEFAPNKALDIWHLNGLWQCSIYPGFPDGGGCDASNGGRYYGADNVRDKVDVYVSRTSLRIVVNGRTFINEVIPNIGFDRAYLYLVQASYNPAKDGETGEALQTFHWDSVAWDGPILPRHSLTPAGSRDVVFQAYGQASCRVGTYLAAPMGMAQGYTWVSWTARVPDDGRAWTPADVVCLNGEGGTRWGDTGRKPFEFEVIDPTP